MASGNDPANIPYIIVENGFYYVAYKEKVKVPEVVVSSKGVANGLSEEYNDGWDFGPDSYSPTSTSAIPYTQTSGIQEFFDYLINNQSLGITGMIKDGVYDLTNAPFQDYTISYDGGDLFPTAQAKILLGNGTPQGSTPYGLTIIASPAPTSSAEVPPAPSPSVGVIFLDKTTGSGTGIQSIIGVKGSVKSNQYMTSLNIHIIGGIGALVAQGSGISGFDFREAQVLDADYIMAGVFGDWPPSEPTNTYQYGLQMPGTLCEYGNVRSIAITGGLYNGVYLGHHPYITIAQIWGEINAFVIGQIVHEGAMLGCDVEYTVNIFSTYNNTGVAVNTNILSVLHMAVANYNTNDTNGAAWMVPQNFLNLPSGTGLGSPIHIHNLQFGGTYVPSGYYTNVDFSRIIIDSIFSDPQYNPYISNTSGTTAGTIEQYLERYSINYKKFVFYFSGYENDSTTNQVIDFIQSFTTVAGITANTTGLTISVTTSGITITAPDSTTTYSGIVIIEGY